MNAAPETVPAPGGPSVAARGGRRRWQGGAVWGTALAFAVAQGAWWWFTQAKVPPSDPLRRSATSVSLLPSSEVEAGLALREQAEVFDPAPLFLPTERTFAYQAPATERERRGDEFALYEPHLTFREQSLEGRFLAREAAPLRESEALRADSTPLALGFGQGEAGALSLPARQGFIDILTWEGGQRVAALPVISPEPVPKAPWDPLEFWVQVSPAGLITRPTLAKSSGLEEVDAYWQTFLTARFRLGERLAAGAYRVVIGP